MSGPGKTHAPERVAPARAKKAGARIAQRTATDAAKDAAGRNRPRNSGLARALATPASPPTRAMPTPRVGAPVNLSLQALKAGPGGVAPPVRPPRSVAPARPVAASAGQAAPAGQVAPVAQAAPVAQREGVVAPPKPAVTGPGAQTGAGVDGQDGTAPATVAAPAAATPPGTRTLPPVPKPAPRKPGPKPSDPSGGKGAGKGGKKPPAPKPVPTPAPAPTAGIAPAPTGAYGQGTLVDFELAEHERWVKAGGPGYVASAKTVGGAGTDQRAEWIVGQYGQGLGEGLLAGLGTGFGLGVVAGLAGAFSKRAIPVVGGLIGGGLALNTILSRKEEDWKASWDRIKAVGTGEDEFEILANSIDAYVEILSYVSLGLNLFNGYISAAAAIAFIAAPFTGGATLPAAGVLAGIAEAVGLAILTIDAIRSLVFAPLAATFRALHLYAKDADPRLVEQGGADLKRSAADLSGFVGGVAGAVAGEAAAGAGVKVAGGKKNVGPERPTGRGGKGGEGDEGAGGTGGGKGAGATGPKTERLAPTGIEAPPPQVEVEVGGVRTPADEGPPSSVKKPLVSRGTLPAGTKVPCKSPADALATFREMKAADPTREVAILQNTKDPSKWMVIQGDEGSVTNDLGPDWQFRDHNHPQLKGALPVTPIMGRIASGADFDHAIEPQVKRTFRLQFVEEVIHLDLGKKGQDVALYGFDPHAQPHPYFLDYPGQMPDPVTGQPVDARIVVRFKSKESYKKWVDDAVAKGQPDPKTADSFSIGGGSGGPSAVRGGGAGGGGTRAPTVTVDNTGGGGSGDAGTNTRREGAGAKPPDTTRTGPPSAIVGPLKPGRNIVPIVPDYKNPPASQEQLDALKKQVEAARQAQAAAAKLKGAAKSEASKTAQQKGQLDALGQKADEHVTTAGQAGGQVNDTKAAADKKSGDNKSTEDSIGTYAEKRASLVVLYNNVNRVKQVTAVFASLKAVPIERVQKGAAVMDKMNHTAADFMAKMDTINAKMNDQGKAAAARTLGIGDDKSKIDQAGKDVDQAKSDSTATKTNLGTAGGAVQNRNVDAQGTANTAAGHEAKAGASADAKTAQHQDLSSKLSAWAVEHATDRRKAADAIVAKLKATPDVRILNVQA